jgi:hypothetical protein
VKSAAVRGAAEESGQLPPPQMPPFSSAAASQGPPRRSSIFDQNSLPCTAATICCRCCRPIRAPCRLLLLLGSLATLQLLSAAADMVVLDGASFKAVARLQVAPQRGWCEEGRPGEGALLECHRQPFSNHHLCRQREPRQLTHPSIPVPSSRMLSPNYMS